MKKGDIVLVNFPFSDFENYKLRPAIVLVPENKYGDICLCFITSKILSDNDAVIIKETDKYFNKTGLKISSTIRVSKIVTIENRLIAGKIGYLSNEYIKSINKILKNIFQI